jgi:cation diffusion facilitator family transporter
MAPETGMTIEKKRVAFGSILASAGLAIAKAIVGLATGSLAILSEAAHSLIDCAAAIMTYFAVSISGKPADEEHHYGHGKFESVTALAETALLFLISGIVFWEAGRRLLGLETHVVEATAMAFAVIVVSIVVDYFRARALNRVAKATSSQALEADALHFSSDMWSSMAVLIGLAGVAAGYQWMDSAAAFVVAIFVCIAGWRLGRRTIDALTDVAPAGAAQKIESAASAVPGVVGVERVRVRPVGPTLFVELAAIVSRTLPLDRVEQLKQAVAAAVQKSLDAREIQVTVTTEPRALNNESVMERVMVIARNRGLAIHHVTVHDISGKRAISLDLELDGAMPLGRAHETADALERAIGEDLGDGVEVETHIEPLQAAELAGKDAPPTVTEAIAAAMRGWTGAAGKIRDVHDVRVRETPSGLIVNFHCRADPSLSVQAVHAAVDELEHRLCEQRPDIHRAIGHAEPAAP